MTEPRRPSLVAMVRAIVAAPFEERALREETARYERLQLAAAETTLQEIVRRVEPEEDGWIPLGAARRDQDEAGASSLREAAQRAALENPHAIGYLRSLRRFVMGKGASVRIEHEDEAVREAASRWFRLFERWNAWDSLEDEIPERTWRDGEAFIRRFDQPPEPTVDPKAEPLLRRAGITVAELQDERPPDGMTFLRLVPPEEIADPTGSVSHGILTAADDVRTVLGYCWSVGGQLKEIIPAGEMLHVRIRADSDVKRGRSVLEPLLKRMKQFDDWLNYRIILNLMRTAVVLVKTVEGSPGQIAAIRDAQQKQREDTTNDRKLRMLKPGTTVHASPGVKYEFKHPQIAAQDAKDDGRAILLTMAAATGLPEYMFTGDAANANYASTMVAESPAVREFEDWQDFFTPIWTQIFRWALVAGARAGQIESLEEDAAREVPLVVEWPPLLSREVLAHAQANELRFKAGVLSREGFARDEGIDWDVERERLAQEAAEASNVPLDALLANLAAAGTAGLLTPDTGLEDWLRTRLGIPALVGEEPPEPPPHEEA